MAGGIFRRGLGDALSKKMNEPFDLLLGRKTFDIWAPYWPEHGDIWPQVNTAVKYVASNTLTSSAWQPTVFLSGDIAETIAKSSSNPVQTCTSGAALI